MTTDAPSIILLSRGLPTADLTQIAERLSSSIRGAALVGNRGDADLLRDDLGLDERSFYFAPTSVGHTLPDEMLLSYVARRAEVDTYVSVVASGGRIIVRPRSEWTPRATAASDRASQSVLTLWGDMLRAQDRCAQALLWCPNQQPKPPRNITRNVYPLANLEVCDFVASARRVLRVVGVEGEPPLAWLAQIYATSHSDDTGDRLDTFLQVWFSAFTVRAAWLETRRMLGGSYVSHWRALETLLYLNAMRSGLVEHSARTGWKWSLSQSDSEPPTVYGLLRALGYTDPVYHHYRRLRNQCPWGHGFLGLSHQCVHGLKGLVAGLSRELGVREPLSRLARDIRQLFEASELVDLLSGQPAPKTNTSAGYVPQALEPRH